MKHFVIYVPGLGDSRTYGQPKLLALWKLTGITPVYHAVGWSDGEDFKPKLNRLVELIDRLKTDGDKVSLVGVSAGASAVLSAYSLRPDKITGVVCISGKIQNGDKVGPPVYNRNPAFRQSMAGLPEVLDKLTSSDKARIMSIRPIKDRTVPPPDTLIPGAKEKVVPALGHIQSIFYCLLFCGPAIARFLKSL